MKRRKADAVGARAEGAGRNPRRGAVLACLALCAAAVFAVYANSLRGPFVFDDLPQIVENPDIKRLGNLRTRLMAGYSKDRPYNRNDPSRPLTYLSFTLNYHLGGLEPFGYHLVNVGLHLLCVWLVFFLSRRMLARSGLRDADLFPLLAALFFAVHPIDTEVVSYVYHRSESLAALFFLAALLLFDASLERGAAVHLLSLGSFVLALFSKQTAATLPALVLVYDYAVVGGCGWEGALRRRWRHAAYWAVLAAYALFRLRYLGGIGDTETDAYARWTNLSYLAVQAGVVLRYIGLLLWPSGLCVDHVVDPPRALWGASTLLPAAVLAAALVAVLAAFRRKSPGARVLAFAGTWFFVGLSPTSSFLPILDAMADRRVYLPGIGFHLAAALAYSAAFAAGGRRARALIVLSGLHLFALGWATAARNRVYSSPEALWTDVVRKYPANYRAHNNLGNLLFAKGDSEGARREYERAIAINPRYAGSYTNLGNLCFARDELAQALLWYERGAAIEPGTAGMHANLGNVYYRQGDFERAYAEFRRAAELSANYPEARYSLGLVLEARKDIEGARREYAKALELDPRLPQAHNSLGRLAALEGRIPEAELSYHRALDADPGFADARCNLGLLYERSGEREKAAVEFQAALRLEPGHPEALKGLERVRARP